MRVLSLYFIGMNLKMGNVLSLNIRGKNSHVFTSREAAWSYDWPRLQEEVRRFLTTFCSPFFVGLE